MRKFVDTRSLKFKLWTYFGLFAALIMVVLWLLQIIFLSTYYENMKIHQIEKLGRMLVNEYGESDFEDTIYRSSFDNGVIVQLLDENGNPVLGTNLFGDGKGPRDRSQREFRYFLNRVQEDDDKIVAYKDENNFMHAQSVVFGAELQSNTDGSHTYLYMQSPLAPIGATQQVLQNQLLIVTVLSLAFAFVLSYFIARRLSQPITKITESAAELATGDYNVVFDEEGYTEISRLASALNYTTSELSKTDELRRDLVANVSHDLRTPLTIIKSYAEMIRDISGENPEKRMQHTNVIIDESDRLGALVNDLLDLSRLESGILELNLTEFDLSQTVQSLMKGFQVLADNEQYVFHVSCEDNCLVRADEQRIEQVVYNLVSNAVNYTGRDKTVTVNVKHANGRVRFAVADTGKGIEKDELPRVWERYYKSSQKHRRMGHGTGIGLSIVKNVLEAHHARYGVSSEVGKGSVFWFEI